MKKAAFILAISLCLFSCSKKTEPKDERKFDSIIGHWTEYAYFTSENFFIQTDSESYYDFDSEGVCTYYSGHVLDSFTEYQYTFDKKTQIVTCLHERGWNLSIVVEYLSEKEAIFYVTGRTSSSSKTIKVRRN